MMTLTSAPAIAVPDHESGPAASEWGPGVEGLEWVERVGRYYEPEQIQAPMMEQLVHQCRWHAIDARSGVYGAVRAVVDWLATLAMVVVASPLLVVLALCVRASSEGPAIYSQLRVGRRGSVFRLYKFRTMVKGAERQVPFAQNHMSGCMFKVPNDARITGFGRFLRRWSLDELPQLFNVLAGDMALIGPRPLELEHAAAVPPDCYDRFAVRPGLTGLWQATQRDLRDGAAKMAMDADYARRRGLLLDVYLMLMTIPTVLRGHGAD